MFCRSLASEIPVEEAFSEPDKGREPLEERVSNGNNGTSYLWKKYLRLETFELPEIKEDEILAHVISDSLCMSSYKAAIQGGDHKRVPADCNVRPTIIGHEFCGEIVAVGKKWADQFQPGQRFAIQPAMNYKGSLDAPGYSFQYMGGDATYVVISSCVMETGCLAAL